MRKRVIPVLLLDRRRRLVKTVRFGPRTYVGDPFNVVRLFNEKEVDEIVVLDIDAGIDGRAPDVGFLRELASECFMPLAYGGGITQMHHCEQLNRIGVEKLVLGHAAFRSDLISDACRDFGSQALVACLDVVGSGEGAYCVSHSGRVKHDIHPRLMSRSLQDAGVGEIILQSVDHDGVREGMNLVLIDDVSQHIDIPLVALGGAGNLAHLAHAMRSGASAVASGSAFTFIGRLRAVLITYPSRRDIDQALKEGVA